MSKPQLSFRIPRNVRDDIEDIREQEDIEDRSEAARQVLRRGLDYYERGGDDERGGGELLGQLTTSIGGVGTVAALIGALLGQSWATPLLIPFALTTFLFALLWASVRVLAGRDLV